MEIEKTDVALLEHLTNRHLQIQRYNSIHVNEADRVVSFYLWNLSGQLIGFQKYRPGAPKDRKNDEGHGRYYTYATPQYRGNYHAVWGLETYNYRDDILCFTEGIFDACRLHNYGIPAVAVCSNNPKPLKKWLNILPKKLIGIRDNDAAGKKFESIFDTCFTMENKDLGDSSENEVAKVVEKILDLR